MNRKARFLGRRLIREDGVRVPFRSLNAESGKSRTMSFYVPKSDVFLVNSFIRYVTQHRHEHVNRALMRAIRFLIQNLDYEEQRKFRLALRQTAEEDAVEAIEVNSFLSKVLKNPGERIDKILSDRSTSMVVRRQRLFKDALKWFGCWEEYQQEFNLVDPDSKEAHISSSDNHSDETL